MSNIEFREQLSNRDPKLDTRGYLDSVSKQISQDQSQINLFTKKETYASDYSSTFNYTGTVQQPRQVMLVDSLANNKVSDSIFPLVSVEKVQVEELQSRTPERDQDISYNQSMRFDSRNLIERCAEDRLKDEENLDQTEYHKSAFFGTQGTQNDHVEPDEEELNDEGMRITVEKKLTSTSEIDLQAANRTIVGGVKKSDGVADESTRRDINFTATGLSYQLVDESNFAGDSLYLGGTNNPVNLFGSQNQENLNFRVEPHFEEEEDETLVDPDGNHYESDHSSNRQFPSNKGNEDLGWEEKEQEPDAQEQDDQGGD